MIELVRASIKDAELIWNMQIKAFADLLEKYQDYDTNPGNESIEKIMVRLKPENSYYYVIKKDAHDVGAICVEYMEDGEKRISPVFVLQEYQNQGIAQEAIREVERIHGSDHWALETVLEEKKNCYLYEKMGYQDTGKRERVNEKLTMILYYKK